jgi:signal transduction histidine kinase
MARMIDQLLDFTRVRLGAGIPLQRTAVDVTQLVRQIIDELEVGKDRPHVRLEIDGEDARGVWDGDRLAQVFSNLVANALQHGEREYGASVSIDGRAPDRVEVRVQSRGAIDGEHLAHLFEPMAGRGRPRGASAPKPTSSESSRGLGLGLYISHELVRTHGGRIEVRSDPVNGTTFNVILPRSLEA